MIREGTKLAWSEHGQPEYRQTMAPVQCCYDQHGGLITTGDWGGTVDYDANNHVNEDVYPYRLLQRCGRLDVYFKYRPIDNRNNCPPNAGSPTHKCETRFRRCGAMSTLMDAFFIELWGGIDDFIRAGATGDTSIAY